MTEGILSVAGVVAIDDGGSSTCVVTKDIKENFPSVKGYYGKRNLTEITHKHDFIVEYKGHSYVAGMLAKYDCTMPLQMHTESKQHDFYDLSVLIAIHQYGYASNSIVVSTPIKSYSIQERDGRLKRLKGSHTISVNGVSKTFAIADVKVAPETASAFWINEPQGKTRYIDFGSRTIGVATTLKENDIVRFIDTESDTFFGKGIEALEEDYNPRGLAD
ncbi:ParM/StbA family protein [Lysinibacillus sp. NPDC093712]|uniref:ParM/StbA family protein n=1 Tax=Lysinibacillus sp. NPDC093712 TaxID=3390579 RepID=UPI003CFFC30F